MGSAHRRGKRQRFKRYPIGFFHIDIAEVQTAEGKLYLFVSIDRTAKFAVTQLVDKADRQTAWEFPEYLQQNDDRFRATGQIDGAVVVADRDVFLTHTIGDAFAVVDVGVPGVAVEHENRPIGRTNAKGKLLVPGLRAFEKNRITIDPADLPLDTAIDATREIVIPAERSGVVVRFAGGTAAAAALVTFRDADGAFVELGATGRLEGSQDPFVVGYDGQAYVEGLSAQNRITIERMSGERCSAEFPYEAQAGSQVAITDIACRPVG